MRKNIFGVIALIGGILLTASCVKEISSNNELYRPEGSPIIFAAATGYNNGIETRTEYSGVTQTVTGYTNPVERINWVADDAIKIHYVNGSRTSVYYVGSPDANREKSTAGIDSEDPLTWAGGSSDHVFYGMYPNTGFDAGHGANNTARLNVSEVSGTVPAGQTVYWNSTKGAYNPDMALGYLACKKTVSASSTERTVDLPFRPATTTFQFKFKLRTGDDPVTVSKFEMISTAKIAGGFSFNMASGADADKHDQASWGDVTTSSTSNTITVTFDNAPTLSSSSALDFTVFALPVNISNVTLKFTFTNGTSKSLKLQRDGTWETFAACKKYVITNDYVPGEGEVWDYYIDPIQDVVTYGHLKTTTSTPFQVTSYKVKRGTTTKVPVSWKIQYSTDGSSWSDTPDDKQNVNITAGGGGTTLTVNNGANVVRDHYDSEYSGDSPLDDAAIAALRSAPEIPAAAKDTDGYYDLSKHPIYGDNQFAGPTSMETANCYVIQRPGLYKFPLVYGNAIKGGVTNTPAFDVSSQHVEGDESYFLPVFRNHEDNPITKPWIKDNSITVTSAVICWQDVTESNIIIQDADVAVVGDYIKFEVKRGLIRPGNVVIAAKAGNTIVWSWHIWITEKDLTPHPTKDYYNASYGMMNYNLGWTDATTAKSWKWNNWDLQVRVTQDETGGTSRVFHIKQIGDSESVDPNVGSNTFYQWGRKDPMLPAKYTDADKDQYSATGREWKKTSSETLLTGSNLKFGHSIQNPNLQYTSLGGNEGYWDGNSYFLGNLWDSGLKNNVSWGDNAARRPVKTVYDPCPPGYVVPNANAFTYFAGGIDYTSPLGSGTLHGTLHSNGYEFSDHSGSGGKIFFPFCGARAHDGNHGDGHTSIYDVNSLGYYWTACANRFDSDADYSGVRGRRTSKMMIMTREYIRACHEQRKGACYAVRPILEN